ncbi:MAG: ABC transporter ATP-binding protein [Solirubrobacteraceae bacterium]
MSELTFADLHKRFGDCVVLSGLDLSVPAGSFTAILGPSGAGKTTLLRLLAGFEFPDRGSIEIGGRVVAAPGTHVHPEKRRIGYVPQEGSLFPHLTVAANVGFGLPRAARRRAVAGLLELVGLNGLERRYPHQLSGGQQQRVALARALAVQPEVVLLDEPFASLDANLRADVRDEVRRILHEAGTTTLLVTHYQDEALSVADRVAVLRDGTIVQHATPHDLYAEPADRELAGFVGDANLIDGQLDDRLVDTPLGTLPARWHGEPSSTPCPVTALIRPEQITVGRADDVGRPVGRVLRSSYHGHDTVLHVQLASERDGPVVLVRTLGDAQLPPGESVALSARGPVLVWPRASDP